MQDLFNNVLLRKVDGFSLGVFRALFGAFMIYEIAYFQSAQFVEMGVLGPIGTFEYDFLTWIQPLSEGGMQGLMLLLLLSAVGICLGVFFKPASILFTIGFTYLLFLGKGHYNNHFYLFCLIAFYFCFTQADRNFSLRKTSTDADRSVPLWNLQLFRAAFFITYFYGGLSKLNPDWVSCQEPIRSLLGATASPSSTFNSEWFIHLLAYGSIAIDLSIGFLLLAKRTRVIGVVAVVIFNLLNALVLFDDIGIFPYVMLCGTLVFFEPEGKFVHRFRNRVVKTSRKKKKTVDVQYASKKPVLYFLIAFMVLQLLLPFRSALLPGNSNWTGIGRKFSWRMKIQSRQVVEWKLVAINRETGVESELPQDQLFSMVNTLQYRYMAENPVMVWQFAQYLSQRTLKKELVGYSLHARIKVVYNGREPQYLIDPNVDLLTAKYDPLQANSWIMPISEGCQ